jgi:hypothetical protein
MFTHVLYLASSPLVVVVASWILAAALATTSADAGTGGLSDSELELCSGGDVAAALLAWGSAQTSTKGGDRRPSINMPDGGDGKYHRYSKSRNIALHHAHDLCKSISGQGSMEWAGLKSHREVISREILRRDTTRGIDTSQEHINQLERDVGWPELRGQLSVPPTASQAHQC